MPHVGLKERAALFTRRLSVDFSNFHLLHYRKVDGFLITAKNSGTHWLRFMMSQALASEFNLPPPIHSSGRQSDDFVGHPRWGKKYEQIPFIGSSHNLPSRLFSSPAVRRVLRSPPIVVLVRDIEEAMLSHFVKWKEVHGLTLRDYVRSPAPGRRDLADAWWYIDFFNRWGRMAANFPGEVMIVRYEDLMADTAGWLAAIFEHLNVDMSWASVRAAVRTADRATVRGGLDPDYGEAIVPDAGARAAVRLSADDRAHLRALFARRLEFSLGYGYGESARLSLDARRESGRSPEAAAL